MTLSVGIAVITVWAAIASSYLSNWPIGFFVGAISAFAYAIGRTWTARMHHGDALHTTDRAARHLRPTA
jgi:hypothetical protein